MAGAPNYFIQSLIRFASINGREPLEAIVTGNFTQGLGAAGGKQLVTGSVGGKSVTYQIPARLSIDQLMASASEALTWFDSMDAAGVDRMLNTRPITRQLLRF